MRAISVSRSSNQRELVGIELLGVAAELPVTALDDSRHVAMLSNSIPTALRQH